MCGIAGAIGNTTQRVVKAVQDAHGAQVHRGPDAEGMWQSEGARGVVFAHRRLSIIDLSPGGAQPMVDAVRGNTICFNGEIYNYRALRSELQALGEEFHSESDTEVLLKAYGVWGRDCVKRLRGMFAFALFDAGTGRVLLARDRVGIKPLYYAEVDTDEGRTVLFASELRALLATGLVERKLDRDGLASFVWHGFVGSDCTIVQGVRLLPAGSWAEVSVSDPAVVPQRYWHLPAATEQHDTLGELSTALTDAVGLRLVSDVPLGVFLSGGIDSSAVAAIAARSSSTPVKTFTITFDEPDFDESRYAQAVATGLGTEHTEVPLTQQTFHAHLEAALDSLDQPTFDAINSFFVSRAVREAGITVALAGTGGDELFGGYTSFSDLPRARPVSRAASLFPRAAVGAAAHAVARLKTGPAGAVPPQTRWGKLDDVLQTSGDLVDLYQVSYALYTRKLASELMLERPPEGWVGLDEERRRALTACSAGSPDLHAISNLELSSFIEQRLLRDTDAASMAVSLEVRVPLLDHEVIEAAARVRQARRFDPLGEKRALRDMGLVGLDPAIFDRPKSGFVLPIERWCRERLQDTVTDTLLDAEGCRAVGLDPDVVARLWKAFCEGAPGIYWSRVWALFILLRWSRRHGLTL